jgi:hypothetical protein
VTSFLATLYGFGKQRFTNEKEMTERHLPLLGGLNVGHEPPVEYRMDTKSGWLAFKTKTGQWRAVPFSVDAWRQLAQDVFIPKDVDKNLVNDDRFGPAYRLILGDVPTPNDAELKKRSPSVAVPFQGNAPVRFGKK